MTHSNYNLPLGLQCRLCTIKVLFTSVVLPSLNMSGPMYILLSDGTIFTCHVPLVSVASTRDHTCQHARSSTKQTPINQSQLHPRIRSTRRGLDATLHPEATRTKPDPTRHHQRPRYVPGTNRRDRPAYRTASRSIIVSPSSPSSKPRSCGKQRK